MHRKFGSWVWLGGGALAAIAGMVNAIGFLGYSHQAVTHLSGTTTLLSVAAQRLDASVALHLGAVIVSFLLGAALSGFIVRGQSLKLGRRYGVALGIEGALLFAAALLLRHRIEAGSYLASAACGLQNAMATTYSGAILRTTHVTGIVTDIGSALGHALRGLDVEWSRIRLLCIVLAGFFVGGIAGTFLFGLVGTDALFYPAFCIFAVALAYTAYAHHRRLTAVQPAP